nr:MATE family efflux transporter [uncultured Oribacterium sp.]
MKKSYELDMTTGAILPKMLKFCFPLMFTGILQLLFNAADVFVVGKYVGAVAMAAVGTSGPIINLLVNLFLGLSVGVNVAVARYIGADKRKDVEELLSTAYTTALLSGFLLLLIGNLLISAIIQGMNTPEEVAPQAETYLRYFSLGIPFMVLYDFLAAVFRAVGDTRRPLYVQILAGLLNLALNLNFVIQWKMGVAGVAIATSISQLFSAVVLVILLAREKEALHLHPLRFRIHRDKLKKIVSIGLPAGIQGTLFSISNVMIQSAINTFGSQAMAAATISANLEGFVYISMNSISQGQMSFVSQNLGAKKYSRLNSILKSSLTLLFSIALLTGIIVFFFGRNLAGIFTKDGEVLQYAKERLEIIVYPYMIFGMMDTLVGALRGFGCSIQPMFISLVGICLSRVFYVMVLFPMEFFHGLRPLYISYPVSWMITAFSLWIMYFYIRKQYPKVDYR